MRCFCKSFFKLLSLLFLCSNALVANELLYKNGFLYSSEKPFYIPSHYVKKAPNLWIDKNQTVTFSEDQHCCIIGFCVDIENPEWDCHQIAKHLSIELSKSEKAFHRYGAQLCGRYIIFYYTPEGSYQIVTDAATLRPVYHNASATIITGHPKLLLINMHNDQSFVYQRSTRRVGRKPFEASFTWDQTLPDFKDAYQLNPSFSLETQTGKTIRFFPFEKLKSMSKQALKKEMARLTSNSLKAFIRQKKKPILMGLTSGMDCRALLAIMLEHNIQPNLTFTYRTDLGCNTKDCEFGKHLAGLMNIPHIIANEEPIPDNTNFREALCSNTQFAFRNMTDQNIAGFFKAFGQDKYVCINANISDFWRWFDTPRPMPKQILDTYRFNSISYYNLYFLLDLEQYMRWLSDYLVHVEIVCDTFNPFNSRKLIHTMLSIPSPVGAYTKEQIHHELIQKMYKKLRKKVGSKP